MTFIVNRGYENDLSTIQAVFQTGYKDGKREGWTGGLTEAVKIVNAYLAVVDERTSEGKAVTVELRKIRDALTNAIRSR